MKARDKRQGRLAGAANAYHTFVEEVKLAVDDWLRSRAQQRPWASIPPPH